MAKGKWKGTLEISCANCNFTEEIKVTLFSDEQIKEVIHICPRCKATAKCHVTRRMMTEVKL